MTTEAAGSPYSFKLSDLWERLEVSEHDVRHVLNEGVLPPGADPAPGRGRHRRFDAAAAFWLSVVLRLKAVGLQVPAAAKVADRIADAKRQAGVQGDPWIVAGGGGPRDAAGPGRPARWLLEVGDGLFLRIKPDRPAGPRNERAWVELETGKAIDPRSSDDPRPVVVVRLDLTELARLLFGRRSIRRARRTG